MTNRHAMIMQILACITVIAACCIVLMSCTLVAVKKTDGTLFLKLGGILVNKEGSTSFTNSYIGKDNILYEDTISDYGKENTDNQLEAMRLLYNAGVQAGKAAK